MNSSLRQHVNSIPVVEMNTACLAVSGQTHKDVNTTCSQWKYAQNKEGQSDINFTLRHINGSNILF